MHIDERIFAEKELDTDLNILANAWEDVPEFHYASFATATRDARGEARALRPDDRGDPADRPLAQRSREPRRGRDA